MASIPIHENYKDYRPPRYVRFTIAELLSTLPEHYLSGLQSVVLTNAAAIGKGKTRRVQGKKYLRQLCRGFYHSVGKDQPAWIEIVVDNIIAPYGARGINRMAMRISIVRSVVLGEVLFHEVGHHLDFTIGAPARSGEAAAEAWSSRLMASYFRKRYWYLVPFMRIAAVLSRALTRRRETVGKAT